MPGLGISVLSNVLATIAVAVVGWLLSVVLRLPFVYRRRRHLFTFLGMNETDPRLTVYLSTVFVRPGGSVDFQGTPRTFAGPAIPAAELSVTEPIAKLFADPMLEGLPVAIRMWLGKRVHWSFRSLTPDFRASPQDRSQVTSGNLLTVGSQYYNSAGDLYTETCGTVLKMEQGTQTHGMTIRVRKGPRAGDTFQQRAGQLDDLAIVEKVCDPATKSTVFIAAGLGVVGTMGAVQFLAEHWNELWQQFGTKPFAICLRFHDVLQDPNAFKKPVELSRFSAEQPYRSTA